ncbi:shikimate kinase [Desulfosarcina sp.]|uniref:shikimate kinase n=1 Tax=Desulfosarcina sp. TaxID=2027861 RepID=UPI0029BC7CC5|nr:shikimate kinase [Desulfosarcina sp.]MDX2452934.1 shikimate kinase [Desulfosarcina sp.]MDX2490668.1 shikimate kinase [Desulfosarcina sp.]
MVKKQNLILIGMPGAGKSTIGVLLAKRLGVSFLDTDILMQTGEGCYLQETIADHGLDGFRRIEERYLLTVPPDCGIVATGGSAVYSRKAMAHLRSLGPAVYLQIDLVPLKDRLGNLDERGVLRMPGQTIDMLYDERCPLYKRFADITVSTSGVTPDRVVAQVLRQL